MPNLIPVDDDPFMGAASTAPNSIPADRDPFAAAPAVTLVPVDHDPFANGPGTPVRLVPVDYDPFAPAAPGPARLVPVDYDPFADGPGTPARRVPVDYDPFADSAAAPAIAGQSLPQPNPQPSSAGSSIRNFPSKGVYIAPSGATEFEDDQLTAIGQVGATMVEPGGKGIDAEIAAFGAAESEPQLIAASRPFCPACRDAIRGRGGLITSPTTAVFPRNIPSVAFPSTPR